MVMVMVVVVAVAMVAAGVVGQAKTVVFSIFCRIIMVLNPTKQLIYLELSIQTKMDNL